MSTRAGIVLIQDGKVALIERARAGQHYFTFPGGHIEAGETPEQAAVREVEEELGLEVRLIRLLFQFFWKEDWQYYYLAEAQGGVFGSGRGEEMHTIDAKHGSYQPVWIRLEEMADLPVKPPELAQWVFRWAKQGFPLQPVVVWEKPQPAERG